MINRMQDKYLRIIHMERPVSQYPHASMSDRAAQFGAFAPLEGMKEEHERAAQEYCCEDIEYIEGEDYA